MPYREQVKADHQLSMYAATKKSTESLSHAYAHLFDLPTTVFRFFTVYGPWGRPDMAPFKFVKAVLEGNPIDVYNYGDMKRDFTYVDDLNKGNWEFENITDSAGVLCRDNWSTGATFVDINNDGFLDLYVAKSGKPGGDNRHNELFINQGDLTFIESSKEYGLDIEGLSVHASFFDYDGDLDLDAYVLNNSIRSVGTYDLIEGQRNIPSDDGNQLLENIDNIFYNVSSDKGIYSSNIGFGLGITMSDFNGDLWPDLFISNDFFEKDYLYLNNYGQGFSEESSKYFDALSMGSMGADAADMDNDLIPDLTIG